MSNQQIPSRVQMEQPRYSDYESQVIRNKPQNMQHEEAMEARKPNFNPSFQPTMESHEPAVRDSYNAQAYEKVDNRRKKADYGEELRNQMKQKEMQKQQEKMEVRNSYQGNNS